MTAKYCREHVIASMHDMRDSNRSISTEPSAFIESTADFKNTYSYDAANRLVCFAQQTQSAGTAVNLLKL